MNFQDDIDFDRIKDLPHDTQMFIGLALETVRRYHLVEAYLAPLHDNWERTGDKQAAKLIDEGYKILEVTKQALHTLGKATQLMHEAGWRCPGFGDDE